MTNYALSIRESNKQAHIDIENDIQRKQNGLYTFILRVKDKCILDYVMMEYIDGKQKYLKLRGIVIEEWRLKTSL